MVILQGFPRIGTFCEVEWDSLSMHLLKRSWGWHGLGMCSVDLDLDLDLMYTGWFFDPTLTYRIGDVIYVV